VCISLRHTYTAFAGIRRDSLRVRSALSHRLESTDTVDSSALVFKSSQLLCIFSQLSCSACVFMFCVYALRSRSCALLFVFLTNCLIVCSFVSIIVRSLVISGAAKGERRGEASPLWMDVQKLCNICVLSLSWNFVVSHDKYIARPSSKEPRRYTDNTTGTGDFVL